MPPLSKSSRRDTVAAADAAAWEPGYAVRWRHAEDEFAVADWRCDGVRRSAANVGEEIPAHIEITLQRTGWHVRSAQRRDYLVDPLQQTLWPQGAGYRLSHNTGHAQAATLLFLRREALDDWMSAVPGAGGGSVGMLMRGPQLLRCDDVDLAHAALCASRDALRTDELARALVVRLLAHAVGRGDAAAAPTAHETAVVRRAVAYITAHYRERLSLRDIAAAAGVSASRLSALFPRAAGMPVWHYVTELRLRAAVHALAQGTDDLAQLALELGFSSHSHFGARIRARYGRAPRDLAGRLRTSQARL